MSFCDAGDLRISGHAIDRYRQRVLNVSPAEAARQLRDLATDSTRRPTPRWWTQVAPGPGLLFLYPHANPDLCLIVKGNTIVTVFTRVLSLAWRDGESAMASRSTTRRPPYRRPSPGSWPAEAA